MHLKMKNVKTFTLRRRMKSRSNRREKLENMREENDEILIKVE